MEGTAEGGDQIPLLRSHDGAAWEELYRRMYPSMLAFAERRLGGREEARDAVSEAMARAVASIGRFSDRGSGPEGWVFGILRHVVLDANRRSYRRRGAVAIDLETTGEHAEELLAADERAAVRLALARLCDRDRDLLELKVVAGLSSTEVADALGMRPGAVRMAQTRALARLRQLLEETDHARSRA